MDLIRRHQADAGVVMVAIVPVEEVAAEGLCVLDAAEALWELRLVFQSLEAAFGERIVVRGIGPAVRFGDAEIGEQQGCGLGFHRSAAIGVESELAGLHAVFFDSVVEQRLKQRGGFRVGDVPADHSTAENIKDHIEIEVGPFDRSHQFCDVPRPDLIGSRRQKLGLLIGGMAQLAAPFADLAVLGEDAIHGSDRAQIDALVEQAGVDFGGREIDEARPPQHIEDVLLLGVGQRPQGLWTRPRWRRRLFPCEPRGDAGWRARAPALCRPLRSGRCAAPAPLRRPSGVLVVHGRKTQQQSNFFLDFDDRLGALQPFCQEPVVALQLSMFRRQRIGLGDLGAAFDRAQRFKGASVALATPIRQTPTNRAPHGARSPRPLQERLPHDPLRQGCAICPWP